MPQMPDRRTNGCNACPMPGRRRGAWLVLAAALLVSGCSTTDIDRIPQEMGGLPADAPARPAQTPEFPAVHAMPPPRSTKVLDAEQQQKLEADLIALRNRQPNQQKNIARDKAKAEKAAKDKAKKEDRASKRDRNRPAMPGATGSAPGTPPWPVPAQTTGGSARP
jgi:hypothetical protein